MFNSYVRLPEGATKMESATIAAVAATLKQQQQQAHQEQQAHKQQQAHQQRNLRVR